MNQKRSYIKSAAKVDQITDNLGEPVDGHIKPLVIGLMMRGIETCFSCEGHLDHGDPYPWVHVTVGKNILLLMTLVARQNRPVLSSGAPNKNQWVLKPVLEDTLAIIPQNINRSLSDMQNDAKEFGVFLQQMND